MNARAIHVKIKLVTLAAEGRIIRREERKVLARASARRARDEDCEALVLAYQGLHTHRTDPVRVTARHTHLAWGVLRGRPYTAMEARCHHPPDFARVERLVRRFGSAEDVERWPAWLEEARRRLGESG